MGENVDQNMMAALMSSGSMIQVGSKDHERMHSRGQGYAPDRSQYFVVLRLMNYGMFWQIVPKDLKVPPTCLSSSSSSNTSLRPVELSKNILQNLKNKLPKHTVNTPNNVYNNKQTS